MTGGAVTAQARKRLARCQSGAALVATVDSSKTSSERSDGAFLVSLSHRLTFCCMCPAPQGMTGGPR